MIYDVPVGLGWYDEKIAAALPAVSDSNFLASVEIATIKSPR
jgi:hypothetical protein